MKEKYERQREWIKTKTKRYRHLFSGEPSGACPNYFRYGCEEAKRGGKESYANPAWHLSYHINQYMDDSEMEELENLAEKKDNKKIIQWFKFYLPRAMVLIPSHRKESFLKGFWSAVEDGQVF